MQIAKDIVGYIKEHIRTLDNNPQMQIKRLFEHVIGALVHLLTHRKLTTPQISSQNFMHNDILTLQAFIETLEYIRTHHFHIAARYLKPKSKCQS